MGKGADIYSKVKRLDDDFPYEPVGVARLLSHYHALEERLTNAGDYDTAVILCDLKNALDSDILTPRQRQIVALYYFCDLGIETVAEILRIKQPTATKYHVKAVERLASYMRNGGNVRYRCDNSVSRFESKRPLFQWLNEIAEGSAPVYVVPDDVHADLIEWLTEHGDEKALEVARQIRQGAPEVEFTYSIWAEEYPCLSPRQMRYRENKQIPVPEVYPKFDVAGKRKAYVMKDGEVVEKVKKIFVIPR